MDYEKAYKEALERAREFQKSKDGLCVLTAESIFHELKESEDERIRKTLIRVLNENVGNGIEKYGAKLEDALAWLEKQKVMDKEIIFRPLAGTDIIVAAKQALEKIEIGKEVVLAFNGAYIPVNGKTFAEICNEYFAWVEKQGEHDETSIAIKNPEAYRIGFADGEAHAKEEMNTLSDEDKMMLNELIIGFYGYKKQYTNFWKLRTDEIIEWLKKKKDERTIDNG